MRRRPPPTRLPDDPVADKASVPEIVENTTPGIVPLSDRLALSVEEAGQLLGISRDLAYDLVNRGELPSVRLGRRLVVPRKALDALLSGEVSR